MIAMRLAESGQERSSAWDWVTPRVSGNTSAAAQAPAVTAWARGVAPAAMSRWTAQPAAMAANHAPATMCVSRRSTAPWSACSAGTISPATAHTAASRARRRSPAAQPMTAAHSAATATMPVHAVAWESTVSRAPGMLMPRDSVWSMPLT
jgi:hypothetical protein